MKISVLIMSLFISQALHAEIKCTVSENMKGTAVERELDVQLDARGNAYISFAQVEGIRSKGEMVISDSVYVVRLEDEKTHRPIIASGKIEAGGFTRVLAIPRSQTSDSFEIDCEDTREAVPAVAAQVNCLMIEKAGSTVFQTPFVAPVAKNGHDIFELPQPKLGQFKGWVLGYQSLLVIFMISSDDANSITTMGHLNGLTQSQWYPTEQNIHVELQCQGK